MNATPAQVTAALDLFAKRHPVHADNGQHRTTHPDPTTDHIMVQCSCGYRWRYGASELDLVAQPRFVIAPDDATVARYATFVPYTVRPYVRTPK